MYCNDSNNLDELIHQWAGLKVETNNLRDQYNQTVQNMNSLASNTRVMETYRNMPPPPIIVEEYYSDDEVEYDDNSRNVISNIVHNVYNSINHNSLNTEQDNIEYLKQSIISERSNRDTLLAEYHQMLKYFVLNLI